MKEVFKEVQRINKIDPANPSERLCKLFEESGELAQAVNKTTGRKVVKENEKELKELICEEAADTIQCVFSLVDYYQITYEEVIEMMKKKNIKWESVAKKRNK